MGRGGEGNEEWKKLLVIRYWGGSREGLMNDSGFMELAIPFSLRVMLSMALMSFSMTAESVAAVAWSGFIKHDSFLDFR